MRLALSFPPTWEQGPGLATLPGPPNAPPAASISYGPLRLHPDEPRAWQDQVARSELAPGAVVTLLRAIDLQTAVGWPLRILECEVEGTDHVEYRLCAFYTFFEHAAAAVVRTRDRAHLDAARTILASGRPDWRAAPVCVADVWDLESTKQPPKPRAIERGVLDTELARLDATPPTPTTQLERAVVLLGLQRPADALAALEAAGATERAHYLTGVAHGELGNHAEAIAAWTRALALSDRVDTHYNLAQANFVLGQYEQALAGFETVVRREPSDLLVRRKVIQCLYALGRHADGDTARAALRAAWAASADPRTRLVTEYVFDQFDGDGMRIHAIETLRPRDPALFTLLAFRAVAHDRFLPATVVVETSDHAKRAGTPFVLGIHARGQFKVLATLAELPPYADLQRDVVKILAGLGSPDRPSA